MRRKLTPQERRQPTVQQQLADYLMWPVWDEEESVRLMIEVDEEYTGEQFVAFWMDALSNGWPIQRG
jgi:hypothetical protein